MQIYFKLNKVRNIQISKYILKKYSNIQIYSIVQKYKFEYTNIFVPNKNNIRIRILNIRCLIFEYSNIFVLHWFPVLYSRYRGIFTRQ